MTSANYFRQNRLTDRINQALELTNTKKSVLARAIGVKPQVIQFLCTGSTQSSRFTFEIATALGLNTRWLATGEGEIFIANDPKQQFLNQYSRIPCLNNEQLKVLFFSENNIDENSISKWYPLETDDKNMFSIKMIDTSMEPIIPSGGIIFIKEIKNLKPNNGDYVLSFLKKFDTFVVRQFISKVNEIYLSPKNSELFKNIEINNEINILGLVTDCFWNIKR